MLYWSLQVIEYAFTGKELGAQKKDLEMRMMEEWRRLGESDIWGRLREK